MNKMTLLILFVALFYGCEKEVNEQPIDFGFVLLDEAGNPSAAFKEGEDFIFSFLITNTLEEDIVWYNYCEVFSNKDIYKLYKLESDDSGKQTYNLVGQPFEFPVNCQDKPILIKPGEGYYFRRSWLSNPNNANVTIGEYKVEFDISVNINDQKIAKSFTQIIIIE